MDATSIRVPFEGEMIYCLGAVHQAGAYELVAGDNIGSLIELAGGRPVPQPSPGERA